MRLAMMKMQGDMDPAQHGRGAPVAQATAQGGAAGAPGGSPQLAPLHPLTDEEPQRCLDNLDGWHARSSGAERPVLDLVDDPRYQRRCPRCHVRLPVPKARKTHARSAGCPKTMIVQGSGNRPLDICRPLDIYGRRRCNAAS